ncbi:MAG TPA: DUF3710 domain-containing protein [Pedococcus sp.]|nr:DUF3710 domain-containing protein [Pedococcus sp.]
MSIFRRGKNSEQAETDAEAQVSPVEAPAVAEAEAADNEVANDITGSSAEDEGAGAEADAVEVSAAGHDGPYDASEVDSSVGRLDLGALWVVGVPGMELRLEVEETTQNVVGATAVLGDSAVQLQAFAAPKSMGIWDDIRAEIAESIVAQGGTADETRGALGTELRTRMPSAGPDGRTVFAPARFVGVDGPRWFLRAVFSGRAAIDEGAAQTLMQVVRGTVVVRGDAAMAPRELLPLRLPEEVEASEAEDDESEAGASSDDLKPFERGPEITEVR